MELPPLYKTYAAVFGTAAGQEVLEDLLAAYHERPSAYVLGATNAMDMAFLEGQRSVVLGITAILKAFNAHHEEGESDGRYDTTSE